MTNTHTLSRRIVAALVERGIEVPQEWAHDGYYCPECKRVLPWEEVTFYEKHTVCRTPVIDSAVPDLAQPQNLHLLLEVARSLGSAYELECCPREEFVPQERTSFKFKHPLWGDRHYGETESLAVLAAVCAALGIEVEA